MNDSIALLGEKIKQLLFRNDLVKSEAAGLALLQNNDSIVIFKRWFADEVSIVNTVGKCYYSMDKFGKFQFGPSPESLDYIPTIELHQL